MRKQFPKFDWLWGVELAVLAAIFFLVGSFLGTVLELALLTWGRS